MLLGLGRTSISSICRFNRCSFRARGVLEEVRFRPLSSSDVPPPPIEAKEKQSSNNTAPVAPTPPGSNNNDDK